MNNHSLTREQHDLIELLDSELQTQLDDSLTGVSTATEEQRLTQLAEALDNYADAAELIGLQGLTLAWRHLALNIRQLTELSLTSDSGNLGAEHSLLVDSWTLYFLDYLQRLRSDNLCASTVSGLAEFLGNSAWPTPLDSAQQTALVEQLVHAEVTALEDNALPNIATPDMLSLTLGDEINPDLFEGLMLELPGQVNTFAEQIATFIHNGNKTALASAQRIAHTIKGAGNVVGVTGLANFMHFSEDLLEEIARQDGTPNSTLKNLLTDMADTLAAMLDSLLAGESAGAQELGVMQEVLNAYHIIREEGLDAYIAVVGGRDMAAAEQHSATESEIDTPSVNVNEASHTPNLQESIASQLRIKEETAQDLLRLAGTNAIGTNRLQTQVKGIKQHLLHISQLHGKLTSLTEEFGHLIEVRELFKQRVLAKNDDGLDPLELDRYNELHSFFHQLQEFTTDARDAIYDTQGELQALEEQTYQQQVTNRESQNLLLEMRMIPANSMEARFQRCVRQACRLTGKKAGFILLGSETMIDSRVLHELVDPIMHLLRNAVDHGIETPAARLKQGKTEEGVITLSFRTQGQSILVRVSDDGSGLDHQRIAAKAAELSITAPDESQTDSWLNQLIFAPGFSTRDQVSQTSGRGIGLDMVADRITQLKGRITVDSKPKIGCDFIIRLPMTMIAEHGLLIKSGAHQLVVSSRGIEQLLFLDGSTLAQTGEQLQYPFNDKMLDVYPIAQLARLPNAISFDTASARALLVVETLPGQQVGVLVESVSASREMVIKPLTPFTPSIPGIIGATILGDGSVAPVIDVQHLMLEQMKAGIHGLSHQNNQDLFARLPANPKPMALVVDDSLSTRRSLAQFVSDMGMDVCTAKDGFEAVDILHAQMPSVILVDMEMPRMNGLEFTAHVRANEATRHIPVIMITSRNTEKHRNLARAAGVDNYLNKPFSEDELLHSLQASMHH